MDYSADIYTLSSEFYEDYPKEKYPEILIKKSRPYSCLMIEYADDLLIYIPFRSNARHKYAYHFRNSERSKRSLSGLDYTKALLIKDTHYPDGGSIAVVDQDEYKETVRNLDKITDDVCRYISDYRDDLNGVVKLHPKEWQRRYGTSTLPYFNDLLMENSLFGDGK